MNIENPALIGLSVLMERLSVSHNLLGNNAPNAPDLARAMADILERDVDEPSANGVPPDAHIRRFRLETVAFLRRLAADPAWLPLDREEKPVRPLELDPKIWKGVLS